MEEKYFDFWLCSISELGYQKREKLVEYFGSPREIFYGRSRTAAPIAALDERQREALMALGDCGEIERAYQDMERRGISFVSFREERFPKKLREIPQPPRGLFYRGRLPDGTLPAVAVVGARDASGEGLALAEKFGRELAANGIPVVSGMARGVDIAAQRGAMQAPGGRTYSVLGCGVDVCYPKNHLEDFMEIQERGGILSEFPLGTPPLPYHFPIRNRLISGLAEGILVIEAREGSGSLITAELGLEQGKEIFVLPGSICNPLYRGGNALLKSGAFPVTCVADILDGLGLFFDEDVVERKKKTNVLLESTEKIVYAILSLEPVSLSFLVEETGLKPQEICGCLVSLQGRGLVRETEDRRYCIAL